MKILELGSYIAPAYAGMILAEQGHQVTKWTTDDPIHDLRHGDELWEWISHGKHIERKHATTVVDLQPGQFDAVIDNFRASTWERWGVDLSREAARLGVVWVSLRGEGDQRSFDVIAQARAWGDLCPPVPFYLGDTAAGLWLAFKALAAPVGHHVIRQATCLAKLVEGELVVPRPPEQYPWDDPDDYGSTTREAFVQFKGAVQYEPMRDATWRAANLTHERGRYIV